MSHAGVEVLHVQLHWLVLVFFTEILDNYPQIITHSHKHFTHLTAREDRTQGRSHWTPFLCFHQEQIFGNHRIDAFIDCDTMVLKIFEIFDGYLFNQERIADVVHRCHELVMTEESVEDK